MAAILRRSLLRCLPVARPSFIPVPPRQGGNLADWKSSPPAQSAWGDWTVAREAPGPHLVIPACVHCFSAPEVDSPRRLLSSSAAV